MKLNLLSILFSICVIANAQTVTWNGGAGTLNWEDKGNWDSGEPPCQSCDVFIANSDVQISSNQMVKSVTFDGTTHEY